MMYLNSISKRQWTLVSVGVIVVAVIVWGIQAGYLLEIGKFFAYDANYYPVTPTPSSQGKVSLSIRPLTGDTGGIGLIPIRINVETPVQLYVTSIAPGLALTAADLILQSSSNLQIIRFEPSDLPEILKPAQISQIPNGPSQLRVTVGSGTTPVGGNPILGTIYVMATKDATGYLELNLMGDTQITAAGHSENVLGGFSPRRFVVLSSVAGDANGDGKVDIFDYNLVVSNFGQTGSGIQGDLDNNDKVDIFDYNLVVSNFGEQASTPTPTSVPVGATIQFSPEALPTTVLSIGTQALTRMNVVSLPSNTMWSWKSAVFSVTKSDGLMLDNWKVYRDGVDITGSGTLSVHQDTTGDDSRLTVTFELSSEPHTIPLQFELRLSADVSGSIQPGSYVQTKTTSATSWYGNTNVTISGLPFTQTLYE